MLSPIVAASGPVIPNFGGGSSCIVQNRQFCASWFVHNFSSRFEPRLIEHIVLTAIAVGIGFLIAFTAAIIAYKKSWFEGPFSLVSAFLYTIPSLALFELLVPITGINHTTVEVGLVSYNLLMAGSLIAVVPVRIVALLAPRKVVDGLALGAVK